MRILLLFFACFFILEQTEAQKRFLVSPNSEVIPLSPQETAAEVLKARMNRISSSTVTCPDKFTFGYPPDMYTVNSNFGSHHRDVLGQWYVAPASGTIDSIFWFNRAEIGAYDSTIFLRVHRSNIGPDYGPGIRPGPFNPPCQNWGYWVNTNDLDNGIAAFVEEATNPNWISTINGSPVPSAPPFGEELWGAGGYPVRIKPNTESFAAMSDLSSPLTVTTGDKFFISMRIGHENNAQGGHKEQGTEEARTEWNASGFTVGTNDPDYPSRNWKFYEHEKGPSNCAGFPIDSIQAGWVARGGFGTDTLTVASYSVWYAMTVTSNVPPIPVEDVLYTTFSTEPREVCVTITDCSTIPESAGVAAAVISYTINGVLQAEIPFVYQGGDIWCATIPGQPPGSEVSYKVKATDKEGAIGETVSVTYQIRALGNEWYSIDTALVCDEQDISTNGTEIPPSSFFVPSYPGSGTYPKDDGTAGPFDMGGKFILFADTFRYAWVGINGAIALSKSPDDTMHVNANGFHTTAWDFPYATSCPPAEIPNCMAMPKMFIAPYWADLLLGDSLGTYGKIRYGNNNDPCKFVVQWDSIGTFDSGGGGVDGTAFRVILNRCDGTVEFQYESVGLTGLDSAALVGMQYDTSSAEKQNPYIYINKLTYPYETKPRNNWCIKMSPNIGASVNDGWNIVSVKGIPKDGNYATTHLFPQAVSKAWTRRCDVGYVATDTLKMGEGYWLKFSGSKHAGGVSMIYVSSIANNVCNNWNIVGSTSGFVPTNTIVPGGGTAVTSPYYGYSGGYYVATTIAPGQGYWVKVAGAGTLTMTASAASPKAQPTAAELGIDGMNTITIRDSRGKAQTLYVGEESRLKQDISYFELPPVPPVSAFDARFSASGRMVETYPNAINGAIEYPVSIQSASYPVTVSWKLNEMENRKFEITGGNKTTEMGSTGTRVISDSKINTFVIRVAEGSIPKEFALSQNYPNPFNPVTRFRVDVATTSQVEVAVYDILGRKITTLLNAERVAGSYTMEWDGKDNRGLTVPTGIYFIRMTAGEFTDSKKITFMK